MFVAKTRPQNVLVAVKSRPKKCIFVENLIDNVMYIRKIDKLLLDWKNYEDRKPLVVRGCRQCGKTSTVISFAKKAL